MREHDLLVIGSGSGLDVANTAIEMDMDVAVIEKDPLGGTCLNRGCIPSKMLIHRADLVQKIKDSGKFHIDSQVNGVDFESIVEEVNNEVSSDSDHIEEAWREDDERTLYKGKAKFIDEKTVEVNGEEVRGEKIVVAAGARPFIPPIKGIKEVNYLTSKEALKLRRSPSRLVVVGGGYVAAELSHFFGSMGTDVTIIGSRENMLKREDKDIRERFTEVFKEKHDVKTGYRAKEAYEKDGEVHVKAQEKETRDWIDVKGDELLLATGRKPNTDILEVGKGGIMKDEDGFVKTNEYLETTAEDTWALGDIVNNYMFKHTANWEARYVTINALMDHKHEVDYTAMPHAIFSNPQVSGVGKTEEELEEEDMDYAKAKYPYKNTTMGAAFKEKNGFVKVLVNPKGKILGCHIIGPRASMLIHEVVMAMKSGSGHIEDLDRAVHVHPALNEVVQRAFRKLR